MPRMKNLFLILAAILFAIIPTHGQPCDNYLLPFSVTDSTGSEYSGFKTPSGEIVIPAKYMNLFTDTMCRMAIVMTPDWETICINRNDSVLCHPFIYDNGPDYISEGVFRIIENGKMGFANSDGEIVIPPVFDFVCPFGDGAEEFKEPGIAEYIMGGYRKTIGEHWWWEGGYESGYINHSGERFSKVEKLINGRRKAWKVDGKQVFLDKNGDVIQE